MQPSQPLSHPMLFACQPGVLTIQSCGNCGQSLNPPCGPCALMEPHLLGILVPKEAFHDSLVPVHIDPTAPDLHPEFRQHLADHAHGLLPRVNLEKLGPLQWPPSVDPRQGIGDLCCGLASQRLSLFVAAGDVNDRESIGKGLPAPLGHAAERVSWLDGPRLTR